MCSRLNPNLVTTCNSIHMTNLTVHPLNPVLFCVSCSAVKAFSILQYPDICSLTPHTPPTTSVINFPSKLFLCTRFFILVSIDTLIWIIIGWSWGCLCIFSIPGTYSLVLLPSLTNKNYSRHFQMAWSGSTGQYFSQLRTIIHPFLFISPWPSRQSSHLPFPGWLK